MKRKQLFWVSKSNYYKFSRIEYLKEEEKMVDPDKVSYKWKKLKKDPWMDQKNGKGKSETVVNLLYNEIIYIHQHYRPFRHMDLIF